MMNDFLHIFTYLIIAYLSGWDIRTNEVGLGQEIGSEGLSVSR